MVLRYEYAKNIPHIEIDIFKQPEKKNFYKGYFDFLFKNRIPIKQEFSTRQKIAYAIVSFDYPIPPIIQSIYEFILEKFEITFEGTEEEKAIKMEKWKKNIRSTLSNNSDFFRSIRILIYDDDRFLSEEKRWTIVPSLKKEASILPNFDILYQ